MAFLAVHICQIIMRKEINIPCLLATEKIIVYKISGKSMMPMLVPNRDLVIIKSVEPNEIFAINDVVLYFNNKDNLVLHRIVEIKDDNTFVLLGDNCSYKEYDVDRNRIIGKLSSFKHYGIHYTLTNPKYQEYVCLLRRKENLRMKKKAVYDFIVYHVGKYIPTSKLPVFKHLLRRAILCKYQDIRY